MLTRSPCDPLREGSALLPWDAFRGHCQKSLEMYFLCQSRGIDRHAAFSRHRVSAEGGKVPFFPRGLGTLGYVLAILFVVLYLGRLTILSPTHPLILVSALLSGFLVGPAWYGWLGVVLQHAPPSRPGDS